MEGLGRCNKKRGRAEYGGREQKNETEIVEKGKQVKEENRKKNCKKTKVLTFFSKCW